MDEWTNVIEKGDILVRCTSGVHGCNLFYKYSGALHLGAYI